MLGSPTTRSGSSPDLATSSGNNITLRKRKHDEDLQDSFTDFSRTIMATLKDWKAELNQNFSVINDNVNNVIKQDLTKLNESTIEMKTEIKSILQDFHTFKKTVDTLAEKQKVLECEVTSIQTSVQFLSDQQDDAVKTVECFSSYIKKIDLLETQLIDMKKENNMLRADINSTEQRERLMNLEIIGIPETKDENLMALVVKLAKLTDIDLSEDEIIHVHRITPRIKVQGRPRVIIVKFKSRLIRDNLLSRARKMKLRTNMLQFTGEGNNIYINEQLTFYNKQLLKRCKEIAKLRLYQYVWVKNGKIFTRKNDVSPAVPILKEEDLEKIK